MVTFVSPLRLRGASVLALMLSVGALLGGPALAAPTDVLARVDGAEITQRDVDLAADDLAGSLQQMPEEQRRDYILGYLIDLKLIAKAAQEAKLAEGEAFARRLGYLRDKALMEAYLTDAGEKASSDEATRKVYDDTVKNLKPETEVRARHILTETEDEAKAALAKVKGGEDFAKVAKEASKDPGSAESGGELGFFSKDQMVAPFAEAAFKLEPGQISDPVKSDFGWHVIQVEEKREKAIPSFDQVKPQIANFVARRAQQDTILKLRSAAKIERTEQAKPAPTPGAQPPATDAPAAGAPGAEAPKP